MAEGRGGRGRRAAAEDNQALPESAKTAGWFVICKTEELGTEPAGDPTGTVKLGERLTVIKVVKNDKPNQGADYIARQHRGEKEAEWAAARESGEAHPDFPDGLPDRFPAHLYRVISLGSFVPGHSVQETRKAEVGTF